MKRNNKGQFTSEGLKENKFAKGNPPNKTSFKKGEHYSPETEFKSEEMKIKQKGDSNSYWKGGKPKCKICGEKLEDYRTQICRKCFIKENTPLWLGGKSFEPYGLEFNNQLKEKIRQRDKYRCQECFRCQNELFTKDGKPYKLIIHHIDFNKQNNQENNLISLCRNCHLQTNYNRENWREYFKNKIYE